MEATTSSPMLHGEPSEFVNESPARWIVGFMTHGNGSSGSERVRVVEANRRQLELRTVDLESLLPQEHRARGVWSVVERLDSSEF